MEQVRELLTEIDDNKGVAASGLSRCVSALL